MGTVHGVYLKYVGLSALSYAGLAYLATNPDGSKLSVWELVRFSSQSFFLVNSASSARSTTTHGAASIGNPVSLIRALPALVLGYSVVVNGVISILFKMESGMKLIGKDPRTGAIPTWSYIIFFPFHGPTRLYTYLHILMGKLEQKIQADGTVQHKVPVATEVQPGWWVGSCYGHELDIDWAGVVDLTVEIPETTIYRTDAYLSLPTWDGVPATPEQLEEAANFCVQAKQQHAGNNNTTTAHILVHCAHGRGRSTTVMCACLVKAGLFPTWQEALEKGIVPQRPVCKLNRRMKENLTAWQALYMDHADDELKKAQ